MEAEVRPFGGYDIILDIETVSALSQAQYDQALSEIEAPKSYGEEAAAKYRATKSDSIHEKAALSPKTGRVCCLGLCPVEDISKAEAIIDQSEKFILHAMDKVLAGDPMRGLPIRLITYSRPATPFDLPFLIVREAVHHMAPRFVLPWGKYDRKRHINLMEVLGGEGSLESWEILFLGKKKEIQGSQIQELWDRGEHEIIRRHCLEDVQRTAEIWRLVRPVIEGSAETQKAE
jgi:hypothetical protein